MQYPNERSDASTRGIAKVNFRARRRAVTLGDSPQRSLAADLPDQPYLALARGLMSNGPGTREGATKVAGPSFLNGTAPIMLCLQRCPRRAHFWAFVPATHGVCPGSCTDPGQTPLT